MKTFLSVLALLAITLPAVADQGVTAFHAAPNTYSIHNNYDWPVTVFYSMKYLWHKNANEDSESGSVEVKARGYSGVYSPTGTNIIQFSLGTVLPSADGKLNHVPAQ